MPISPFRRVRSALLLGAALVGSALALGACDSGAPDNPADVDAAVGTWVLDSLVTRTYATPTHTLHLADPTQPGTGALTFSGALTGQIRYFSAFYDNGASDDIVLGAVGLSEPLTYPAYVVSLSNSRHRAELRVYTGSASPTTYTDVDYDEAMYTYVDGRLTMPTRTLTTWGTPPITLGGTLEFATRALPANAEGLLTSESRSYLEEAAVPHYVFEEDGGFALEWVSGDATLRYDGTWERLDDTHVRVVYSNGADPVTMGFAVRRTGRALTLTRIDRECDGSAPACLADAGYGYDAVSHARWESAYYFGPNDGARPARPGATSEPPAWALLLPDTNGATD